MSAGAVAGNGLALVVVSIAAGVLVAIIGLAFVGWFVQRWRQLAEARLDDMSSRVLELAMALSDETRAEGYEARVRLIRAAHAAMNDQQRREKRSS